VATKERSTPAVILCECGCGEPAPIAARNWHSKGITKGQALRFICGHHRRGKIQSKEEKSKRVKTWTVRDASFSPYLPDNRVVRYAADQQRWYCSNPKKVSQTVTHAKAVYEHYYGEVPAGFAVHHKSGSARSLADDDPKNLMIVQRIWNWRYFPDLAQGFGVPENTVTKLYIESVKEGAEEKDLFKSVCKKLIQLTE